MKRKRKYTSVCRAGILIWILSLCLACSSHVLYKTHPAEGAASTDHEVNAAFSQTAYADTLTYDPGLLAADTDTAVTVSPENKLPLSYDSGSLKTKPAKQTSLQPRLKEKQNDDPPVLVKKPLPLWKIIVGILLCLVGLSLSFYAIYGMAVLISVGLLLFTFGADLAILLVGFIGLFLLAVLALMAGNITAIIGYNFLLRDDSKRILFKRRKKS